MAGLVAMQTLWAGPWMIKVAGYTRCRPPPVFSGSTVAMLGAPFWAWGLVNPWLARRGLHALIA